MVNACIVTTEEVGSECDRFASKTRVYLAFSQFGDVKGNIS